MTLTDQERQDLVAILKAQDAAKNMRSATISVNGHNVTCYETGEISRKHPQSGKILRGFGGLKPGGYLHTCIAGKHVKVHRLIYEAFNGKMADGMHVDHIDGDKQNNCIDNLRAMTCRENNRAHRNKKANASSKYRGVNWHKRDKCWMASIGTKSGSLYIGRFKSEIKAARAFDEKAIELGYAKEALNFQHESDETRLS